MELLGGWGPWGPRLASGRQALLGSLALWPMVPVGAGGSRRLTCSGESKAVGRIHATETPPHPEHTLFY